MGKIDHGRMREFMQEGRRLVPLLAPKGPTDVARIDGIRADSPLGKELVELSTILATRQKLPSGLEVKHAVVGDVDARIAKLVESLVKAGIPADRMVRDVLAGAAMRKPEDDVVLKAGLELLGAAAGITKNKEGGKALADHLIEGIKGK